jgi:hypothetical protein
VAASRKTENGYRSSRCQVADADFPPALFVGFFYHLALTGGVPLPIVLVRGGVDGPFPLDFARKPTVRTPGSGIYPFSLSPAIFLFIGFFYENLRGAYPYSPAAVFGEFPVGIGAPLAAGEI